MDLDDPKSLIRTPKLLIGSEPMTSGRFNRSERTGRNIPKPTSTCSVAPLIVLMCAAAMRTPAFAVAVLRYRLGSNWTRIGLPPI